MKKYTQHKYRAIGTRIAALQCAHTRTHTCVGSVVRGRDDDKKYDFCVTECERFAACEGRCPHALSDSRPPERGRVCARDDDKLEYYDFVERRRERERGKKTDGKKKNTLDGGGGGGGGSFGR